MIQGFSGFGVSGKQQGMSIGLDFSLDGTETGAPPWVFDLNVRADVDTISGVYEYPFGYECCACVIVCAALHALKCRFSELVYDIAIGIIYCPGSLHFSLVAGTRACVFIVFFHEQRVSF